jgi:hypothetical protein
MNVNKQPRFRDRSAAEPQPKDDRIGFATCVGSADAAPFRVELLGFGLRPPVRHHARGFASKVMSY